jgi:hypothetical protein
MKPPSQSPRKQSMLSDSLQRRLNAYAVAASAAGVGMLALAQPAEARIIYTKTHHVIGTGGTYHLRLDDKGADFLIYQRLLRSGWSLLRAEGLGDNAVEGYATGRGSWGICYPSSGGGCADALLKGSAVSSKRTFVANRKGALMVETFCSENCGYRAGPWGRNRADGYLGLKFKIGQQIHYGWVHMTVSVPDNGTIKATVLGYAYETIANKPIITGKTKGLGVVTVQPGSLGHLAAGRK